MANPRIEDLRKRLEKEPSSRLFAQLAEELRKEGELAEAIRVCREGLQKQQNYPSAHMTLGRALFDNGDLAGARAEFDAVLKGAPDNILASRLLGECLERLGDAEGALSRYRTTLALAPGDRQVTARIQALEQAAGAPRPRPAPVASAEATLIMPSTAEPPSAPRAPWAQPTDVTQPATPALFFTAEPAASGGPAAAPIPVSEVREETFELEQPYEAPTLVAFPSPGGTVTPAAHDVAYTGSAAGDAPLAAAPLEESFEPRDEPPAPAAEPTGPMAPSPPEAVETPVVGAAEATFDFAAGTVEMVPAWQAPPTRVEPEFVEAAPEDAPPAANAAQLEMSTATLAELYLSQGVLDKAIAVYRQLLEREPDNARARTRLGEIQALDSQLREEEARAAAEATAAKTPGASRRQAIERTIARLETLLAAFKRT